MPAGGGVAGQPVSAYLVGRRRFVLVDPGDPTGPALDRALELARARGGADRGGRPDPCRPGPRRGCPGRRRAPRDPGVRRSRRRSVAAVRDPRAARPRACSTPATSRSGSCRRPVSAAITSRFVDAGGRFVIVGDLEARAAPARSPGRSTWPPACLRRARPGGGPRRRLADRSSGRLTSRGGDLAGCRGPDTVRFDTSRRAPRALADGRHGAGGRRGRRGIGRQP